MTELDVDALDWEKSGGLIPTIVQDARTGQVLMLAYMNRESLQKTLEIRRVTFWSRSRGELWTKGGTSGNYLHFKDAQIDCDADAILVRAIPQGPTCHRGTVSCFSEEKEPTGLSFLAFLEDLINRRKHDLPEDSYTAEMFRKGLPEVARKVGEEAIEVIVSLLEDRERTVSESADLLYHLLVFLAARDLSLEEVVRELVRRHR